MEDLVGPKLSAPELAELADLGAWIELCALTCVGALATRPVSDLAGAAERVGPARCTLASDYGQAMNVAPVEGLQQFADLMAAEGSERRRDPHDGRRQPGHARLPLTTAPPRPDRRRAPRVRAASSTAAGRRDVRAEVLVERVASYTSCARRNRLRPDRVSDTTVPRRSSGCTRRSTIPSASIRCTSRLSPGWLYRTRIRSCRSRSCIRPPARSRYASAEYVPESMPASRSSAATTSRSTGWYTSTSALQSRWVSSCEPPPLSDGGRRAAARTRPAPAG